MAAAAVFRERLGTDEETLELPSGARVRDAVDALAARHTAIAGLRGNDPAVISDSQILSAVQALP